MGGLETQRQNHFFFDMVNSEAMVSQTFVSYSLIFFVMNPLRTNFISPLPFLPLPLQFLISKFSMENWAEGKLSSSLVLLRTNIQVEVFQTHL